VAAVVRRFENRLVVWRLGDGQACELVEGRLRIEALDMTGAAEHEQPDHALRPRPEVRRAGAGAAVAVQHGPQGEAAEAHAAVGEEAAARPAAYGVSSRSHVALPSLTGS